jgi:hypothetical protein
VKRCRLFVYRFETKFDLADERFCVPRPYTEPEVTFIEEIDLTAFPLKIRDACDSGLITGETTKT